MGTKERLEILNEKYMTQEQFNDIWKNAKIRISKTKEPIKWYSQDDINKKDKEIKRLKNIINELEKWLEENTHKVFEDVSIEYNLAYRHILDKIKELKGSDKE